MLLRCDLNPSVYPVLFDVFLRDERVSEHQEPVREAMLRKARPWSRPVDQMDEWLEAQGFYRKHTARDGTCLYRAVAEQLFFTQVYHSDVRRSVVEYILKNPTVFQPMVDEPIDVYAERMRSLKEFGGNVEIHAISIMYRHDFIMYEELGELPQEYTSYGFESKITLCRSLERHYDSVFTKDFINTAAFCQSMVYEMLYKKVFDLKEVDYAVSKMLHDKASKQQREHIPFIDCFSIRFEMRDNYNNVRELLDIGITPFPYKVAKSLDEEVYRNVEYDTWNDYRKGLRYGFCTWNCRELQVGVKCKVNVDENTSHIGHIQEMAPNRGPVVVYIEKIGEKMTVPYKSLEMLPSPPVNLAPARPSPALNLKYATILSSMAARRGQVSTKDDSPKPIKRPTRLHFSSKSKTKEPVKVKIDKPHDNRREAISLQDSKSFARSTYCKEEFSNIDSYQMIQTYTRRDNAGFHEPTSLTEKPDAAEQMHVPVENSKNQIYVLSAQTAAPTNTTVPVNDGQTSTYLPMPIVPPQVNLMALKAVNPDGSDLPHSDLATLRFCYNLGVDCLRMNCLAWNMRVSQTSVILNTPQMVQSHSYMALGSQPVPAENLALTDGSDELMVQPGVPHSTTVTEVIDGQYHGGMPQIIETTHGDNSAYEGSPLVQYPEISSTTPSTPTALPGTYYYPMEGYEQQAVCDLPSPYVEYVYEYGAQTVYPAYPMSYVAQDGVVYQTFVPGTPAPVVVGQPAPM